MGKWQKGSLHKIDGVLRQCDKNVAIMTYNKKALDAKSKALIKL
jgi:hypothetical protein